jgi:hypothetical protein
MAPWTAHETKPAGVHCKKQENTAMLIFMLAAAMTVAMLIATVFGLHQEAERVRFDEKNDRIGHFGPR